MPNSITSDSVETIDRSTLASAASEAHRRTGVTGRLGPRGEKLLRPVRIESVETVFSHSVDLADLGFVMRDRALDRLFSRRERVWDALPWNCDLDDDESSDALEAVLGEEIEWRFA